MVIIKIKIKKLRVKVVPKELMQQMDQLIKRAHRVQKEHFRVKLLKQAVQTVQVVLITMGMEVQHV